jgi:hypothetical protein
MTLFEQVTDFYDTQERKHDLAPGYAEREINSMTQFEFLRALSDALEELSMEKK